MLPDAMRGAQSAGGCTGGDGDGSGGEPDVQFLAAVHAGRRLRSKNQQEEGWGPPPAPQPSAPPGGQNENRKQSGRLAQRVSQAAADGTVPST
jgi:hypothetical protein